jgi:WD40 repeat protein
LRWEEEIILRSYFHIDPLLDDYLDHDDVCFSPGGHAFAVISCSNNISVYRTDGCKFLTKIPNQKYRCTKACYHRTKNALFLNSFHQQDHAARLVDVDTKTFIRYFSGQTGQITSLGVAPKFLLTASVDQTVCVWDESQEGRVNTIQTAEPSNVAVHPNGVCVAIASSSLLSLYDMRNLSGPVLSTRTACPAEVVPHFGMRGRAVMLVGKGFCAQFHLSSLTKQFKIDGVAEDRIPGFAYSPDESFCLVPAKDSAIVVCDTDKGGLVTVLSGHNSTAAAVDFSSAFHNFVSAGKECLFWTVDMATYNALIAQ